MSDDPLKGMGPSKVRVNNEMELWNSDDRRYRNFSYLKELVEGKFRGIDWETIE